MRPITRCIAVAFALAVAGCVTPVPPREDDPWTAPRKTVAEVKAHGDEAADVLLSDLAQAHGLAVKIDKVTGRRILEDPAGMNKVIVSPGNRSVVVNGIEYPLTGEIRWKNGQIWCPGDAPIVFGEHLKRGDVPEVSAKDFAYLDRVPEDLALPSTTNPAPRPEPTAPMATFRIDPNAPPLPASWNVNARTHTWSWIVIHHSATHEGGAASFGRAHSRKWENGLGYHFVIGNGTETGDGEIEIGPRWRKQNQGIDGAHAGVERFNKHGIGICLVGDFDHAIPSPRQLAALRNLIQHLMQRYGIPKDHIIGHRSVKVGHTDCPGKCFPLEQFLQSL